MTEASTKPFVPPGAQTETRAQLEARAYNEALKQKVERVVESKKQLLFSPLGLAGLFPTNRVRIKVKKIKGQPAQLQHVDHQTQLQEAAVALAEQPQEK